MVYRWFCENYYISLTPKCNFFFFNVSWTRASLLAQLVKNLPAMQGTLV